jgi:hypothetical protein
MRMENEADRKYLAKGILRKEEERENKTKKQQLEETN